MPFTTGLPYLNLQTTDYTLLLSDDVVEFNITTGKTATLPSAASQVGKKLTIKNLDTSTAGVQVSIATTGGQTVEGRASGSIKLSPRDWIIIVSDGSNWKAIAIQETVAAAYKNYSNAGAVSTTTGDTIVWTTLSIDTHSAMSGGSYTVVAPGLYLVSAGVEAATTATNPHNLGIRIFQNGGALATGESYIETTSAGRTMQAQVTFLVRCVAGDNLAINAVAVFGQINYSNSSADWINILKVGN